MTVRPSVMNWMLWMLLWAVAAFGLYMVKYQVQAKRVEVAKAEWQLREEEKNLHVLKAEWTYLTRPQRLEQLSAKYLSAAPVGSKQVAEFASLPYSPVALQAQDRGQTVAGSSNVALAGAPHAR